MVSRGQCSATYNCIGYDFWPLGQTPLPSSPNHPGWHKARSAGRQGDDRQAEREATRPHHLPTGIGHGQGCRGSEVPRVLCPHTKGGIFHLFEYYFLTIIYRSDCRGLKLSLMKQFVRFYAQSPR